MRAGFVLSVALGAFIALGAPSLQAREMDSPGGTFRAQVTGVTTNHVANHVGHDRDGDRDGHRHRRHPVALGFFDGGLIDGGEVVVPDDASAPAPVPAAPPLQPAASAADLPPCHETTPQGIVIERGLACSRGAH